MKCVIAGACHSNNSKNKTKMKIEYEVAECQVTFFDIRTFFQKEKNVTSTPVDDYL